jgi:nicotinate phosphoribosyltransferase
LVTEMQRADPGLRRVHEVLIDGGDVTAAGAATLDSSRSRLRATLRTLPWEGLALSRGEPALTTRLVTVV